MRHYTSGLGYGRHETRMIGALKVVNFAYRARDQQDLRPLYTPDRLMLLLFPGRLPLDARSGK